MSAVTAFGATPAGAAVPFGEADFGGYASGVAQYVNVLDGTSIAEIAEANASTDSTGPIGAVTNELDRPVTPAADANAVTNGTALFASLGDTTVIEEGAAAASAPPSSDLAEDSLLELPVDPVVTASVVKGQAQSRYETDRCILGADINRSVGFAADANVLFQGDPATPTVETSAADPERNVNQSMARQRLVAQTDQAGGVIGPDFGFMSQVRQTIAPVTIAGVGTIEVGGEWVLTAVATGLSGQAYVKYGVGTAEGHSTPVLRVIDTAGDVVTQVDLQDVLGQTGVTIPIPGLAEITIGEDPRAIAAPGAAPDPASAPVIAADGTSVAAAVDVARVRLLDGSATDIRIGHMEVTARVPSGGISCPGLNVRKDSSVETATAGETFTWTITIENPYDCTLTNVRVVDEISASNPRILYTIGDTNPDATINGNTVTWELPDIAPGQSATVQVNITLDETPVNGLMRDTATAEGDCAVGSVTGDTNVRLRGTATLSLPRVGLTRLPFTSLPRTGGDRALVGIAAALLVAVGGIELLRRRARTT